MSNHQLYVHLSGGVRGPFTLTQAQQGVAKGQLTPQHQVSYDGKSPFPAAQIWSTLAPEAQPARVAVQTGAQPAVQVAASKAQAMPTATASSRPAKPVAAAASSIGPPTIGPPNVAPTSFGPPAGFEPPSVNVGGGGFPVIETGAAPSGAPMINVGPKLSETEKIAKRKEEEAAAAGVTKEEEATPLGTMIWGGILIAAGIGLYLYFDRLEQEGGSIRIQWWILLIYKTLGKYGVLGVLGVLGILAVIRGALDMAKGKKKYS